MYARTTTWSGSPAVLQSWAEHCERTVKGFVEGQPGNAGVMFFIDEQNNEGLTLTLWTTEEAAAATDKFADQSRKSTVDATGVELVRRGAYRVVTGSEALLSAADH